MLHTIMENTLLIELTNQKAIGLLREMEELNLIRVVKDVTAPGKPKLSEKYRGIITKQDGESLKNHVREMRNEWSDI